MTQGILEFHRAEILGSSPRMTKKVKLGGDDIVGNFKIPRINSRIPRAKN